MSAFVHKRHVVHVCAHVIVHSGIQCVMMCNKGCIQLLFLVHEWMVLVVGLCLLPFVPFAPVNDNVVAWAPVDPYKWPVQHVHTSMQSRAPM